MGKEQLANKIISIDEAKAIVESVVTALSTEKLPPHLAIGRNLSSEVIATVFIPPFNRSAMDGFACRLEDLSEPLKVLGTIAAGESSNITLNKGECLRIMTGAPVPKGADTVIMVEHSESIDENTIRFTKDKTKSNISPKGNDLKPGDVLLKAGSIIKSPQIALLASSGISEVNVYQQAKVGIISSGSELVEPGNALQEGQIYNSNGHQLTSRLNELGIVANNYGVSVDDYDLLKTNISEAITANDLLLITGGVSVGDYDYIPAIVEELGFDIHFSKLHAKPGKHTLFASKENKVILGLPGNPVSTLIQFEECGQWILKAFAGSTHQALRIKSQMACDYSRKKSDRYELLPVIINEEGQVKTIEYHGSAHMQAITEANALLEIPININSLKKGESVYVRPF
ncbi:molybdopterin molybdotransferase MoeA [Carboxylicivirga sp. N1Y90]|uniref:molybdopterin molybdotransferase MoeA n=1 Tax=Carboxylicivirga fragile TaxID=3417571 RepID=UPI003D33CAB7|nr:molybdopterin molybdotransferase MoeA [Marinilabiliaceae bacterium N1Y90]